MSRRANPKFIGGFVIGAIALMVVAALVFGTFTFFQNTRRFVVFFDGSVEGLIVGSPVLFRGVPICQVTQVGQSDTDLYKQIQCDPFVNFSTLDAAIVLVRKPIAR